MADDSGPHYLAKCQVSVLGLSGTLGIGVGKSSLCCRFITPQSNYYERFGEDHNSTISASDFREPEINGEHFVYHGRVGLPYPNPLTELRISVVEHTTFIDEGTMTPFRTGKAYSQRALVEKIKSPGRMKYQSRSGIGSTRDADRDDDTMFPDEFHKRGIDGYVFVLDPTAQEDVRLAQLELLADCRKKAPKKKPFVIVMTKCDSLPLDRQAQLNEDFNVASYFSSESGGKTKSKYAQLVNDIPVFYSSAREKVGIDEPFCYIAHIAQTLPGATRKPIPFSRLYDIRKQLVNRLRSVADGLIRNSELVQIADSWTTRHRQLLAMDCFKNLLYHCGMTECLEVFRMQLLQLHLVHNGHEYSVMAKESTTVTPAGAEFVVEVPNVRRDLCQHVDLKYYLQRCDELQEAALRHGVSIPRLTASISGKPKLVRLGTEPTVIGTVGQPATPSAVPLSVYSEVTLDATTPPSQRAPTFTKPAAVGGEPNKAILIHGYSSSASIQSDDAPPPPVPVKAYETDPETPCSMMSNQSLGLASTAPRQEEENQYDIARDVGPMRSSSRVPPPKAKPQTPAPRDASQTGASSPVWDAISPAELQRIRRQQPLPQVESARAQTLPSTANKPQARPQRAAVYEEVNEVPFPQKSPGKSSAPPKTPQPPPGGPQKKSVGGVVPPSAAAPSGDYDDVVITRAYSSSQPIRVAIPTGVAKTSAAIADPLYDAVGDAADEEHAQTVTSPTQPAADEVLYDMVQAGDATTPTEPGGDDGALLDDMPDDLPPPPDDILDFPEPPPEVLGDTMHDLDLPLPAPDELLANGTEAYCEALPVTLQSAPPPVNEAYAPAGYCEALPVTGTSSVQDTEQSAEGYCDALPVTTDSMSLPNTASGAPPAASKSPSVSAALQNYEDVLDPKACGLVMSGEHGVVRRFSAASNVPPTGAPQSSATQSRSYEDADSFRPTALFAAKLARDAKREQAPPAARTGRSGYEAPMKFSQQPSRPATTAKPNNGQSTYTDASIVRPTDVSARKTSIDAQKAASEQFQTAAARRQSYETPLAPSCTSSKLPSAYEVPVQGPGEAPAGESALSNHGLISKRLTSGSSLFSDLANLEAMLDDPSAFDKLLSKGSEENSGAVSDAKPQQGDMENYAYGCVPAGNVPPSKIQADRIAGPSPLATASQRPFHLLSKSVHADKARPPPVQPQRSLDSATLPAAAAPPAPKPKPKKSVPSPSKKPHLSQNNQLTSANTAASRGIVKSVQNDTSTGKAFTQPTPFPATAAAVRDKLPSPPPAGSDGSAAGSWWETPPTARRHTVTAAGQDAVAPLPSQPSAHPNGNSDTAAEAAVRPVVTRRRTASSNRRPGT